MASLYCIHPNGESSPRYVAPSRVQALAYWPYLANFCRRPGEPKGVAIKPRRIAFRHDHYRVAVIEWGAWAMRIGNAAFERQEDGGIAREKMRSLMLLSGLSRREILRDIDEWEAGNRRLEILPAHTLAVPPVIISTEGGGEIPYAFSTKGEAFREAHSWNQEHINNTQFLMWAIVLEVGRVVWEQDDAEKLTFAAGKIGLESVVVHRPFRVVRPTKREASQFGETITWVLE